MALAKPTVLIVDDDENIRLMLRTTLESGGYRVLEAGGGHEALTTIMAKRPRVVVLDLVMPEFDGMALLQVLAQLPQFRPEDFFPRMETGDYVRPSRLRCPKVDVVKTKLAVGPW